MEIYNVYDYRPICSLYDATYIAVNSNNVYDEDIFIGYPPRRKRFQMLLSQSNLYKELRSN